MKTITDRNALACTINHNDQPRTALEIQVNAIALEMFLYEWHKALCNDPYAEETRAQISALHELAELAKEDIRGLLNRLGASNQN